MRILIVSSLFAPVSVGGAEISAQSLARWLVENGHDVAVYTTVPGTQPGGVTEYEGYRVYSTALPRPYHATEHAGQSGGRKVTWHLEDHFAPSNRAALAAVLDDFRPDVVNLHLVQGAGWNILAELADRDVPTVLTIHDLSLACINAAMHRNGTDCVKLCLPCRVSRDVKHRSMTRIPRFALTAPSRFVSDRLRSLGALPEIEVEHVLNVIRYPEPAVAVPRTDDGILRLLFVGQIAEHKGVEVAINAAAAAVDTVPLRLDVMGSGRDLQRLRRDWADVPWLHFHGQVPLQAVTDQMAASDALLMPSVWNENSPGVIIQALGLGLPVIGSDRGGIPELVSDGLNGKLVAAGDVAAWTEALRMLVIPGVLSALAAGASATRGQFDPDESGKRMVETFRALA